MLETAACTGFTAAPWEAFVFTPILGRYDAAKSCSVGLRSWPPLYHEDMTAWWQVRLYNNISLSPLCLFALYSKCRVIWATFFSKGELTFRHTSTLQMEMEKKHYLWMWPVLSAAGLGVSLGTIFAGYRRETRHRMYLPKAVNFWWALITKSQGKSYQCKKNVKRLNRVSKRL